MLELANTIVVQTGTGIHWEAVIITAVPAAIAAGASIVAAYVTRRNHEHLQAIDRSVNGVEPGSPTVREKVEALAAVTPGATPLAEKIAAGEVAPGISATPAAPAEGGAPDARS